MGLVSKKQAEEVNRAAAERTGGTTNYVTPGIHLMKVESVEGKETAKGDPSVVVTYADTNGNFNPLPEWFVIKEGGKGLEFLTSRMLVAGARISEAETLGDLVKQVKKALLNKKFQVAITHNQRIYKKSETEWYLNHQPSIAYIGTENEDMSFDVATKGLRKLSEAHQAEWDAFMDKKNGRTPDKPAAAEAEDLELDEDPSEDLDDDDIEARIPSGPSTETVKKKAPAKTAPAKKPTAPEPADDDDDDLDFVD